MSVDAAASVYPPSWYAASQPELPLRAPLHGQARADVAVLGALFLAQVAVQAVIAVFPASRLTPLLQKTEQVYWQRPLPSMARHYRCALI